METNNEKVYEHEKFEKKAVQYPMTAVYQQDNLVRSLHYITLHYIKSYLECPKSLRTARTDHAYLVVSFKKTTKQLFCFVFSSLFT